MTSNDGSRINPVEAIKESKMEPIQGPVLSRSIGNSIKAAEETLLKHEEDVRLSVEKKSILKVRLEENTILCLRELYSDVLPANPAELLACLFNDALLRLGWNFFIRPTLKQSSEETFKFNISKRMTR